MAFAKTMTIFELFFEAILKTYYERQSKGLSKTFEQWDDNFF